MKSLNVTSKIRKSPYNDHHTSCNRTVLHNYNKIPHLPTFLRILPPSPFLMIEAAGMSVTMVPIYQTTENCISEVHNHTKFLTHNLLLSSISSVTLTGAELRLESSSLSWDILLGRCEVSFSING
jgi:hypothetical protein